MDKKAILDIITNLHDWLIKHEYRGIDPYQLDEIAFGTLKKFPRQGLTTRIMNGFGNSLQNISLTQHFC